ncbi:peptidase family M48-domain-containing protein [Entophlyctis helioformis]|nr:peptidase family M48-domain-containing protein [Entophlyctis helioformis]
MIVDVDKQLPWKELVLAFSFAVFGWQTYLNLRQHFKLKNETTIPAKVHSAFEPEKLSEEEFTKARLYSLDKSGYTLVSSLYSQIQTVLVFAYDFLPWAWAFAGSLSAKAGFGPDAEIVQSVIFVGIITLISTVVDMPFSLYYTFVLEERHGFNKQTLSLYFMDTIKSLALTAVIGSPVLAGIIWIIKWAGPSFYFYVWLFVFVFQLFFMTIYPTVIQPMFNKFDTLPDGELKTKIDALAASVKFPLTKVFVVDGSKRSAHSNAYFVGLFKNKRIVLFDTLINHSTTDEIIAVLAHELGHWQYNHLMTRLVVVQAHLFTLFYLFSLVMTEDSLYHAFGFDTKPVMIGLMLFQFVYLPVESLIGFFMNIMSRTHEFEADQYAKKKGYAPLLKSALIKLQVSNRSNLNPDKLYSIWHYSHPPLVERLAAIIKTE